MAKANKQRDLVEQSMALLAKILKELDRRDLKGFSDKDLIAASDRMGSTLFRVHQMFPGGLGPKSLEDLAKITLDFIGNDEKSLDTFVGLIVEEKAKRNVDSIGAKA